MAYGDMLRGNSAQLLRAILAARGGGGMSPDKQIASRINPGTPNVPVMDGGAFGQNFMPCPTCGGSGKVPMKRVPDLGGMGGGMGGR